MRKIEIPPFLSHLKVDERGYPIPFFAPVIDGKVNFKYQSREKQKTAMERKICWICGKKLHKDYSYVINGPHGLNNKCASDPPMHRECAEYSMKICPHLHFHSAERKIDHKLPFLAHDKPNELYLIKISKWKYIDEKNGIYRFNVVNSELYLYIDNKLVKQ